MQKAAHAVAEAKHATRMQWEVYRACGKCAAARVPVEIDPLSIQFTPSTSPNIRSISILYDTLYRSTPYCIPTMWKWNADGWRMCADINNDPCCAGHCFCGSDIDSAFYFDGEGQPSIDYDRSIVMS
jgi:hypothetical protein